MSRLMTGSRADRRPTVVVVGAGFGGLRLARRLRDAPVNVVVVDRNNHHLFQPLLYQVASAVLSPADIAYPIRRALRHQANARVVLGEATAVEPAARIVTVSGSALGYDVLVLAAGATHSYFGRDDWAARAPGLKTVDDAVEIRRRVLLAFESAELEADPDARSAKLTFVVVGGGPTGVELAGALKEIATETLRGDFRNVDTREARVVLVEGLARLLPGLSERASARARRALERMGVEVRVGERVTELDREAVHLGAERIAAGTVLWAAGVRGAPLGATLGVPLDSAGRVRVEPDCSVPGHPRCFIIGDLASLRDARGVLVPGVAQGALQMADHVARIITDEASAGRTARRSRAPRASRPAFRFRDRGSMATIGRARAVVDLGGVTYGGIVAWILWSLVHILFLIGFKNRLVVMLSWIWNYAVFAKGARLITGGAAPDVKRLALHPGDVSDRVPRPPVS